MSEDDAEATRSAPTLEELRSYDPKEALDVLGTYIDRCFRRGDAGGTEHALRLLQQLDTEDWAPEFQGILHYFESNAWSDLHQRRADTEGSGWGWEQPELEKQILSLRRAILLGEAKKPPDPWVSKALTNLGNALDGVGRHVESLEFWERALVVDSGQSMALGNRGLGLFNYAAFLYDHGHRALFYARAYRDLTSSMQNPGRLEPEAIRDFARSIKRLESFLDPDSVDQVLQVDEYSLGDTSEERQYRQWALENKLFLNPLNDVDTWSIAGQDVLTLPTVTTTDYQGVEWIALYNQLKQEFVSARFLYYDGLKATEPHYSDRNVLLLNPLDYPVYSLASEKAKASYRMAYSLFDKIAYFLNDYLDLRIPDRRVSFKTLWYAKRSKEKGLRPEFIRRANPPLSGLFWLSKDLYEDRREFQEASLPDARELADVRHHLEHKFLRLHDSPWTANERGEPRRRRLGHSIEYPDFRDRCRRLLKMVRAGLMYLAFAVSEEERVDASQRDPPGEGIRMPMDVWEDEWKRPFP